MKKILTLVSIFLLAIMLSAGCDRSPSSLEQPGGTADSSKPESKNAVKNPVVDLSVTRDFGCKVIFAQEVKYQEGATILDILQAHLRVETAYGGSFVNAINDLKSSSGAGDGTRLDWFYYINGIACEVGVLDYDSRNAASIWWDYHPWQTGPANSAVIGSFPEPFRHGYRGKLKPMVLMSSPDDDQGRRALRETMETYRVSRIITDKLEEERLKNREGPTVVLGKWDALKKLKYLEDFNQAYQRNGSAIHFTDQGLDLLNYNGEVVKKLKGSAGVIIATGEGLGDDCPLWLISGTDDKGWQNALQILLEHPDKIKHLYGAAVVGEEVIPLPVQ
ncbi:MAG: DUF4430 domain-containing protein [Syntrophomonas sp.]